MSFFWYIGSLFQDSCSVRPTHTVLSPLLWSQYFKHKIAIKSLLWFRLLGMAWKQKFLCFGLSSKWAKWVKISRISTKDLLWKLLLTKTKKFIKREESPNQMCAYHISVAFWWGFLCLSCRWTKEVHFCCDLISSYLGRSMSVDSAGLVCWEGEQFVSRQSKLVWRQFVLLDQHCPTPSGWYGNAAVWRHSHKSVHSLLFCPSESSLRENENITKGRTNVFIQWPESLVG